jgi:hypothetical protein
MEVGLPMAGLVGVFVLGVAMILWWPYDKQN